MKKNHLLRAICRVGITIGSLYAVDDVLNKYATRHHKLKSSPNEYFQWNDLKMYYHKEGTGSPVILLHDLHPAASAEEFASIQSELAMNHTVYTLDLPGFGRSTKGNQPYTNFYFVEILREFIETMHLGCVQIVASNQASAVALMANAYKPGLFSRMIMINPPLTEAMEASPDLCSRIKKWFLDLPLIGELLYHIICSRSRIDLSFTERYFYNPFHETSDLVDTFFESAHLDHDQGKYVAANLIGRFVNIPIAHALKQTEIPVEIIAGAQAPDAKAVIQEWTEINPKITSVEIPHTKLLPHLEEPEQTAREILNFLS